MIVYFDVENGTCVKPRSFIAPAYRANFHNLSLMKLEVCWSHEILKFRLENDLEKVQADDRRMATDFKEISSLKKSLGYLATLQATGILNTKPKKFDPERWVYREFWQKE